MEYVWILTICAGLTGWGCGTVNKSAMPSFEACSEQAKAFKLQVNGTLSTDEDAQAAFAICSIRDVSEAPPHPASWNITE